MTGTAGGFVAPSRNKHELEEGAAFTPRFGPDGLITAVVTAASDGELLMVAHMNAQALGLTINTGTAHYWSRSRQSLWKKGETSGNLQTVVEMRTDCDQDVIWLKVKVSGHDATCHTGRHSCFYRIVSDEYGAFRLIDDGSEKQFDPEKVYSIDQ